MKQSKQNKCRYCWSDLRYEPHKTTIIHKCKLDNDSNYSMDWKTVTKEQCKACEKFDSIYIEYPLTINGIENKSIDSGGLYKEKIGCLCEVKPCGEEYQDKTFIGIFLGELPWLICSSFDKNTGILKNSAAYNPAIFIPELKMIIYGCESWWRIIDRIEDLKGITNEDIENTWYMKLLYGLKPQEKR